MCPHRKENKILNVTTVKRIRYFDIYIICTEVLVTYVGDISYGSCHNEIPLQQIVDDQFCVVNLHRKFKKRNAGV